MRISRLFLLILLTIPLRSLADAETDIQLLYPDSTTSSIPFIEFRERDPDAAKDNSGHVLVLLGREKGDVRQYYAIFGFYPETPIFGFLHGPDKMDFKLPDMSEDHSFRTYITPAQETMVGDIMGPLGKGQVT